MKYAVIIDIGSNSIRSMHVERGAAGLIFSQKNVYTTRLAEGLIMSGMLSETAMKRSENAIQAILSAIDLKSTAVYSYATSAVRDARNRATFLERIQNKFGICTDVLSGEDEARYAYSGATDNCGGLIDIGGGSTQVMTASFRKSFPIGCVRMKDMFAGQTLEELKKRTAATLDTFYDLPSLREEKWTAVGGTATTLTALALKLTHYDPKVVSQSSMTCEQLEETLQLLDTMGDGRKLHPLLKERHDVILFGGILFLYLFRKLRINRISFSDADGMEGYALSHIHI